MTASAPYPNTSATIVVGKFLNLYEPIDHQPKEGDFSHIQSLVGHIFGEQYELGMDYLQLLYLYPIQKLPILLLVSEETQHRQKHISEIF